MNISLATMAFAAVLALSLNDLAQAQSHRFDASPHVQDLPRLRQIELSLRLNAQQLSGPQTNIDQARQAVTQSRQMLESMSSAFDWDEFVVARQQVNEANEFLQTARPNLRQAALQIREAADAVLELRQATGDEKSAQLAFTLVADGADTLADGASLARMQEFVGKTMIGPDGRDAGELRNLMLDKSGKVRGAVVEWGGLLGVGEKRAVVAIDSIQFGFGSNSRPRLNMTREDLEAQPRYDPASVDQHGSRFGWGDGVRLYR